MTNSLESITADLDSIVMNMPTINIDLCITTDSIELLPIEIHMECNPPVIDTLSNIPHLKEKLESGFGDRFKHTCNMFIIESTKS